MQQISSISPKCGPPSWYTNTAEENTFSCEVARTDMHAGAHSVEESHARHAPDWARVPNKLNTSGQKYSKDSGGLLSAVIGCRRSSIAGEKLDSSCRLGHGAIANPDSHSLFRLHSTPSALSDVPGDVTSSPLNCDSIFCFHPAAKKQNSVAGVTDAAEGEPITSGIGSSILEVCYNEDDCSEHSWLLSSDLDFYPAELPSPSYDYQLGSSSPGDLAKYEALDTSSFYDLSTVSSMEGCYEAAFEGDYSITNVCVRRGKPFPRSRSCSDLNDRKAVDDQADDIAYDAYSCEHIRNNFFEAAYEMRSIPSYASLEQPLESPRSLECWVKCF